MREIIVSESIRISDSISVSLRTYFSIQHIQSAVILAQKSLDLEKKHGEKFSTYTEFTPELSNDFATHKAYVTGAIFAATSFLEASINEFFSDALDNHNNEIVKKLAVDDRDRLSAMWTQGVPRTAKYSITEKYQIALVLLGLEKLDKSRTPFQDVFGLVKLRNALIHFEPEWQVAAGGEAKAMHELEKLLKGKFNLNPLTGAGNSFIFDKCLGYGCAKWVVKSSIAFADEFFNLLGSKPNFDHVRSDLTLE